MNANQIENEDLLARVVRMSDVMVRAQARVDELTEQLRLAKQDLAQIETEDLPLLMKELGLQELTLADGSKVAVKEDVNCAITEARRPEAHAWLLANGFGGLIKSEVRVAFDRGEIERAREVAEKVGGFVVEAVHPATLKSFVKEQRAAGTNLPTELFGIHPFDKAVLTRPRR